ncbi:MAG: hypothetical protein JWP63_1092, partial [Candidatus Solibacter sp.]|nr:hypothetical protein [Candidatus Solibacter sp.]
MPARLLIAALVLLAPAFTQAPPAIEVAALSANKSGELRMSIDLQPGGKLVMHNVPMKVLLLFAFHLRPEALTGAPNWVDSDRYDIVAKAPEKAPQDESRRMLQTLLAERFKLAVHADHKVLPAYALVIGKSGPKLQPSDAALLSAQRCLPGQAAPGQRRVECRHLPISVLADYLQELAPRDFPVPVVDQTGLQGAYDFQLDWTPTTTPPPDDPGPTIFDAVATQLGLKLESRKLPLPVIVVDHLERV